ncbi:MAG TPA: HupE/UreJ family protein [Thermodesulfobacteriota bacterium]|nr:HupE/UreJ family protein [Thermodesulfobacteriota bacterium]
MASKLRLTILLLSSAVVWVAMPFQEATQAHPLAPSLLEIVERAPGRVEVRWKTPATDVPGAELRPLLPPQCARSREIGVQVVGTGLIKRWEVECDAPLVESSIEVRGISESKANVILRIALADGRKFSSVLSANRPSFIVPERKHSLIVLESYLVLGFKHILTGVDHLLFIFGLLLLIVGRRQLLFTITAFTIGHSITLSLAVLGFVKIPTAPVEALIALSILILAVELTRNTNAPPTLMRRFTWAMALVFGLLHGLGFAGALVQVGLPAGEIPLALFSFNLGIELGQLFFILVIFSAQALLRFVALPLPARSVLFPAYAIGSLSAFWLFERLSRFLGLIYFE